MRLRKWAIAIGVGLSLSQFMTCASKTSALPISPPLILDVEHQPNLATASPPDLSIDNILRFRPQWPLVISFVVGLGAIALALQYHTRYRWQQADYARKAIKDFQNKPGVQNVLSILDFEEYRTQYYTDPKTGKVKSFEATDKRLQRSLREHAAMVKIKAALLKLDDRANTFHDEDPDLETRYRYRDEEFPVEVTLRTWFDAFLMGLEDIEAMIEVGLFKKCDIKPFIYPWIQLIADRSVRRKDGASFYDPLFYYICYSRYTGVEKLFQRFGYKILPPPYTKIDFGRDEEFDSLSFDQNNLYRALCCAKASMLVYEGKTYIKDIVRLWLQPQTNDIDYRQKADESFLDEVIHAWQNEDKANGFDIEENFAFFENKLTDTQAFIFRKDNHIILSFRGTEKFQDWQTNINLKLQTFKIETQSYKLPYPESGRVHIGFFNALKSIESDIIKVLDRWNARPPLGKNASQEGPKLWVTGHSLGGALASLAAISLKCQGFNVSGFYTFGQPRVGDGKFKKTAMSVLTKNGNDNVSIHRYANNNDIVPLIPIGLLALNLKRRYWHFGTFKYFNSQGNLKTPTCIFQQWHDRLWGALYSLVTTGPDAISDHYMEFYVENLQQAIKLEKERMRMSERN